MVLLASHVNAESTEGEATEHVQEAKENPISVAVKAIAAALAIGLAAIATGIAQANIGAAGIGAVAENPKNFGPALVFLALPETLLIFGFTVAAIILFIF
ncbi:MAG: F0F1 ATP synthase subunit C [Chitinivibrionales bacterium]|nr:F0F1 ATP synthase subunit C [Chitinivibrionales bacterium]